MVRRKGVPGPRRSRRRPQLRPGTVPRLWALRWPTGPWLAGRGQMSTRWPAPQSEKNVPGPACGGGSGVVCRVRVLPRLSGVGSTLKRRRGRHLRTCGAGGTRACTAGVARGEAAPARYKPNHLAGLTGGTPRQARARHRGGQRLRDSLTLSLARSQRPQVAWSRHPGWRTADTSRSSTTRDLRVLVSKSMAAWSSSA